MKQLGMLNKILICLNVQEHGPSPGPRSGFQPIFDLETSDSGELPHVIRNQRESQ
jgi:hypothetical protein